MICLKIKAIGGYTVLNFRNEIKLLNHLWAMYHLFGHKRGFKGTSIFDPNEVRLSPVQISKCIHALGLGSIRQRKKKRAYRNYYNSGHRRDVELDKLVEQKIMWRRRTTKEMGGFYYHLTGDGIKVFQEILGPFIEDFD